MVDPRTVPGIGDEFSDAMEQASFLVERGYYQDIERALLALRDHGLSSEAREEVFDTFEDHDR